MEILSVYIWNIIVVNIKGKHNFKHFYYIHIRNYTYPKGRAPTWKHTELSLKWKEGICIGWCLGLALSSSHLNSYIGIGCERFSSASLFNSSFHFFSSQCNFMKMYIGHWLTAFPYNKSAYKLRLLYNNKSTFSHQLSEEVLFILKW